MRKSGLNQTLSRLPFILVREGRLAARYLSGKRYLNTRWDRVSCPQKGWASVRVRVRSILR